MTESLYLSPESSLRLHKLLDQLENIIRSVPASGLKLQLVRHNLFDLVRTLPLSSGTRKKTETLLSLTEKLSTLEGRLEAAESTILDLRMIYRLEEASAPTLPA